jgi:uncharacterized UBP type Zn finger protein
MVLIMKEDSSGKVPVEKKLQEFLSAGLLDDIDCIHFAEVKDVLPSAKGCEDCLKIGDAWVHLRICLECGHVGCCDNSKNKHATRHFHETKHPVIMSYEEEEEWMWCYADEVVIPS